MRIAGVRLPGGRVVWVDAGNIPLVPLDRAEISIDSELLEGDVFVTPEQLLCPPGVLHGFMVNIVRVIAPDIPCTDFPGGGLPPLGSSWDRPPTRGIVVRVDVLRRVATVRGIDGNEAQVLVDVPS